MKPPPPSKEFFEVRASTWDTLHPPAPQAQAIGWGLECVHQHWGALLGKTLVDMGCGTGVLVPHLLEALGEGKLWAVDCAQAMVAQAKAKHADARLQLVCEDALCWAVPPGGVDGVLCYNSFPHFPQEETLKTVAFWLRSGGFFLIWHNFGRKHINSIHREAGGAVAKDRLMPSTALAALALRQGFEVLSQTDDGQRWLVLLKKVLAVAEKTP